MDEHGHRRRARLGVPQGAVCSPLSIFITALTSVLFRLLNRRYEKASIILTSNKGFADWGEMFGDNVLATAILDRLRHHSTTLNIKGESYRLKEKRNANQ